MTIQLGWEKRLDSRFIIRQPVDYDNQIAIISSCIGARVLCHYHIWSCVLVTTLLSVCIATSSGQLQFDYNEEAAGVLDSINSATLLEFYQHNILDLTSYKKMVIVAYGRDKSGLHTNIENPLDYTQLNFLSTV